ncbi:unnamed protein product [Symbiodinium sp. CCMP2592]|nr:unnamed protein product [Symbiodinium sp. CCMP2592]
MWVPSIVWLAWAHSLTRGSSSHTSESGMAVRRTRVLPKLSGKEADSFFETCQANQILQRLHSVPSRVRSKVQKAEEFCERGVGTAVWHPLPNGSLAGFCCPANATWCRGCAEADGDAQACGRCRGGWILKDGHCSACMDLPAWQDLQGRNCHAVVEAGACSTGRFHGVSSAMACCGCSGGLRTATAFAYYSEPMVLGERVVNGHPLPRTASRYSLDSACKLLEYNLTIDGSTGELRLKPGCESVGCGGAMEDFEVSCRITAYEGRLNFSAELVVTASKFLAYENSVLVARAATAAKSATDFTPRFAAEISPRDLQLSCAPELVSGSSAWLRLRDDGGLTVNATAKEGLPGVTDLQLPGLTAASGSLCHVQQGKNVTALAVLVPDTWTSIHYPQASVIVAPGASLGPALEPLTTGQVSPTRFSATCSSNFTNGSMEIEFDDLTGLATVAGYVVFQLNTATGAVQVSPEVNLSHIFDVESTAGKAVPRRGRLDVSCIILGHFEWQVGIPQIPIQGSFHISVQDSTCWKRALDTGHGWSLARSLGGSSLGHGECRRNCRRDPGCAVYSYSPGLCVSLAPCGPHPKDECQPYVEAVEKVANCSMEHTCLNLTAAEPVWLYSGIFCPVAFGVEPATDKLSWVYRKEEPVVSALDVFYLQASEMDPEVACGSGNLLLTRSNATWDFENATSKYMELFGSHVACLVSVSGAEVVPATFERGEVSLFGQNETDYLGIGLRLTLKSQHCPLPETDEDGDDGLVQEALLVDDPTTTTLNDYSLHACDCFPMSWGIEPPVTDESFMSVPGGENQFVPEAIEIARGSLICDQRFLQPVLAMIPFPSSELDCRKACQVQSTCSFYWFGSAANLEQCRLYSDCKALFQEHGSSGVLGGILRSHVCRRADPAKCWAISKRRTFLQTGKEDAGAGGADAGILPAISPCLFSRLVEQCDFQLLLGGFGVEECFGCTHALVHEGDTWPEKRRMPRLFSPGSQLRYSCWAERYTAVTVVQPGTQSPSYNLSCAGGKWWGPAGQLGLSGFACGACVQVVPPDYVRYQEERKQELYFVPSLALKVVIDQLMPLVLNFDGTLQKFFIPDSVQVDFMEGGAALSLPQRAGCLNWLGGHNGSLVISPECQPLWCPTTTAVGCQARPGELFLCRADDRSQCLYSEGSQKLLLNAAGRFCPTSFSATGRRSPAQMRSTARDAALPEDAALLQLRSPVSACATGWPQGALEKAPQAVDLFVWAARHGNHAGQGTFQLRNQINGQCLTATQRDLTSSPCESDELTQRFDQDALDGLLHEQVALSGTNLSGGKRLQEEQQSSHPLFRLSFGKDCGPYCLANLSFQANASTFEGCDLAAAADEPSTTESTFALPTMRFLNGSACLVVVVNRTYLAWSSSCERGYSDWYQNGTRLESVLFPGKCIEFEKGRNHYRFQDCGKENGEDAQWNPELQCISNRLATKCLIYCTSCLGFWWSPIPEVVECDRVPEYYATADRHASPLQRQEDLNVLECPSGSLISYVQKKAWSAFLFYKCSRMAALGSCEPVFPPSYKNSDRAFREAPLACPSSGMGLQRVQIDETDAEGAISFRLHCCYTVPLSTAVRPLGYRLPGVWGQFSVENGVYCPVARDGTGRLTYRQQLSFLDPALPPPKMALYFNFSTGAWCLGSGSCIPSSALEPLQEGPLQGPDWAVVPVDDFDGIFVQGDAKGMAAAVAKGSLKAKPKPTLLTFVGRTQEVAPECKVLVPDYETVGQFLPSSNPCSYVTGPAASWVSKRSAEDEDEDEDPTELLFQSGFDYNKVLGCFKRQGARDTLATVYTDDVSIAGWTINSVGKGLDVICELFGNQIIAPGGAGVKHSASGLCEARAHLATAITQNSFKIAGYAKEKKLAVASSSDCGGQQAAFSRLWCDLHCVKDAVLQGNAAMRTNLEEAVRVVNQNVDALTEYYAGLLNQKLDVLSERLDEFTSQKPTLQVEDLRASLSSRLATVSKLLSEGKLDTVGLTASHRALGNFLLDMRLNLENLKNATASEAGASSSMEEGMEYVLGRTDALEHAVAVLARGRKTSKSRAVGELTVEAARLMQEVARSRNNLLGVYSHRSSEWKNRQKQLLRGPESKSLLESDSILSPINPLSSVNPGDVWQVLVSLDGTWWSLRASLDKYLNQALRHAKTYLAAAKMLHGYVGCSARFDEMQTLYRDFLKAEEEHLKALKEVWAAAVPSAGLLVSKLVDSNALVKLSLADAEVAREELLQDNVCQRLPKNGTELQALVAQRLDASLAAGLSGQTVQQLLVLMQELKMLQTSFSDVGSVPDDVDVMVQTIERAQAVLEESMALPPHLARKLSKICLEVHKTSKVL